MTKATDRRVIVLLGMHRSGTSLVTRGVNALGVYLGDRLMLPNATNPTGFWEDLEFVALNDKILAALGFTWDSVSMLDVGRLSAAEMSCFKREAVDIVRSRFESPLWGFKDPRTARLLPFWRSVFDQLGIGTSYVIVVRHPISVARSLSTLGLSPQHSGLLWLQHNLSAIAWTHPSRRVIVDYDRVIADPVRELERVARILSVPVDDDTKKALDEYGREFVDPGLRHSVFPVFPPQDVALDPNISALAHRAYCILVALAEDWRQADDPGLTRDWTDLVKSFEAMTPLCNWADSLHGELKRLTVAHQLLRREHASHTEHIDALKRHLAMSQDRYEAVADAFRNREAWLRSLEGEQNATREELAAVYRSRSWRTTAPLRYSLQTLQSALVFPPFGTAARRLYHALRVSRYGFSDFPFWHGLSSSRKTDSSPPKTRRSRAEG